MRGFIIKMAIKVVRWIFLNLLLRPVLKKYFEDPFYGFLMRITGGDSPGEDLEQGGAIDGVHIVDGAEGAGDSPV